MQSGWPRWWQGCKPEGELALWQALLELRSSIQIVLQSHTSGYNQQTLALNGTSATYTHISLCLCFSQEEWIKTQPNGSVVKENSWNCTLLPPHKLINICVTAYFYSISNLKKVLLENIHNLILNEIHIHTHTHTHPSLFWNGTNISKMVTLVCIIYWENW